MTDHWAQAYQEIRALVEAEFASKNGDRIVAAAAVHSAESLRRIAEALEALVKLKEPTAPLTSVESAGGDLDR